MPDKSTQPSVNITMGGQGHECADPALAKKNVAKNYLVAGLLKTHSPSATVTMGESGRDSLAA
jgi:hypothetical protein